MEILIFAIIIYLMMDDIVKGVQMTKERKRKEKKEGKK